MKFTAIEKRQLLIALILLCALFGLSIFLCVAFRWYAFFYPSVFFLVAEYFAEVHKYKTLKIPAIVRVINKCRTKHVDISTVADQMPKPILIRSISILTLRDFKTCACDGNLTVLGKGTEDELKTVWADILSQYYTIVESDDMKRHTQLGKDIAILQLNEAKIKACTAILESEIYMPECYSPLKELYPYLELTKETYKNDIKKVRIGEIANKIKLDQLIAKRKTDDDATAETPAQKRRSLTNLLMDISKIEGVRYDDNITVETFAMGLNRRAEYIKNMEQSNKK